MMLLKGVYNAKVKDIQDKIPCTTNLATNVNLNTTINGIKNEIPSISCNCWCQCQKQMCLKAKYLIL